MMNWIIVVVVVREDMGVVNVNQKSDQIKERKGGNLWSGVPSMSKTPAPVVFVKGLLLLHKGFRF